MKPNTTKYWRFINVGRPKDNEEGEGDSKALALATFQFISRIDMGSRVDIQVYRSAEDRAGKSTQADDELAGIDAELDAMMEGQD